MIGDAYARAVADEEERIRLQHGMPKYEPQTFEQIHESCAAILSGAAEVAEGAIDRPSPKAIATLQARAAIAGYQLVRMADGSFVVGKFGLVGSLPDVDAVETFLRKAGAPA